nr:pentatricopeptide repeat-containing protein [Quercus suber]
MSHLGSIACKVTNLKHLSQLHANLIQNSLHHHNYWVALLLTHCTRLHAPLAYTHLIFNSLPCPDAHVFTSMLRYYSQLGAHREVVSLFKHMQYCGIRPAGTFVYPVLIKLAGEACIVFHAQVVKLGHFQDRYVRNVIMDMYAKYGPVKFARKLFDEMPERTLADWNSMISGYWKWGDEVEASRLFNVMPEWNVVTWTSMVTGYAKKGDLESARRYFDEMPEKSVVSWNAMLSGYAQNGFAEKALRLFDDMINAGAQPNETTWVTVISSLSLHGDPCLADLLVRTLDQKKIHLNCFVKTALLDIYYSQLGAHREVVSLFKHMQYCGIRPAGTFVYPVLIKLAGEACIVFHAQVVKLGHFQDRYVRNVIMDMYAKYGPVKFARKLFDEMPERTLADWNSMISGYWKWGDEVEASRLFNVMPEWNVVTWTSMVTGYAKKGDLESARRYFDEMPEKSVVSWNAMLSGYAQNGFAEKALRLFDDMINAGAQPNETTWVTVISSLSLHGDPCLADLLVRTLDQKKIHLNCFVKTALLDMGSD